MEANWKQCAVLLHFWWKDRKTTCWISLSFRDCLKPSLFISFDTNGFLQIASFNQVISLHASEELCWPLPIRLLSNFAISFIQLTPKIFRGNLPLEKSKNWFQSIFKSLNVIVSFYTTSCSHRIFPRFSLGVTGNTPTFQLQGCCSLCE